MELRGLFALDTHTPSETVDRIASRIEARRYGAVNWLGLQTLVTREIMRFMKVSAQTVIAPLMSTLLFLAVFALAFGDRPWGLTDARYLDGLTAGLVMMAVISNSFQNASSSIVIAKVQGNAVDFLMPPISALELAIAFIAGAAARGTIVGVASLLGQRLRLPMSYRSIPSPRCISLSSARSSSARSD